MLISTVIMISSHRGKVCQCCEKCSQEIWRRCWKNGIRSIKSSSKTKREKRKCFARRFRRFKVRILHWVKKKFKFSNEKKKNVNLSLLIFSLLLKGMKVNKDNNAENYRRNKIQRVRSASKKINNLNVELKKETSDKILRDLKR